MTSFEIKKKILGKFWQMWNFHFLSFVDPYEGIRHALLMKLKNVTCYSNQIENGIVNIIE